MTSLKIGNETECNDFVNRHSVFFDRYSNFHTALEISFLREITGNASSADKAILYLEDYVLKILWKLCFYVQTVMELQV